MKKIRIIFLSILFICFTALAFGQTKTEHIRVAGECNTCKKKIEGAARKAGASYALWNSDTKELTIKYNSTSSNTAKIEAEIAAAGYDTPGYKASEEAYNKLDDCCKYERKTANSDACCDSAKCAGSHCMKDGKCTDEAMQKCCKDSGCDKKDCCKKA